jgi:lysozyme
MFPVAALCVALAACGPTKKMVLHGDVDPHPGVAMAREMPVQGIDLSRYQGDVDWKKVRGAGIRFAYLKGSEGGDHIDNRFYQNWDGAAAAGVARGVYHFMYWCRTASEQAVWFTQAVPQDKDQLPPVLDVEWNHGSTTCPRQTTVEDARDKIHKMLEIMEYHTGKRPIIYTDIAFHRDVLEGYFPGYEFWLRSVAAPPADRFENRPWTFWQYTATGRVPGVSGNVDKNVFKGNDGQWRQWLASHGVVGVDDVAYAWRR